VHKFINTLYTMSESDFAKKMSVDTLGFITDWMEGRIMPKNIEFMVTRCCDSNQRSSITHPCVQGIGDKVCRAYVMRTL